MDNIIPLAVAMLSLGKTDFNFTSYTFFLQALI